MHQGTICTPVKIGGIMKVWVARDLNGDLYIYVNKPVLEKDRFYTYDTRMILLSQDDPIGNDITFENSPVQVELVRKDLQNTTIDKLAKTLAVGLTCDNCVIMQHGECDGLPDDCYNKIKEYFNGNNGD